MWVHDCVSPALVVEEGTVRLRTPLGDSNRLLTQGQALNDSGPPKTEAVVAELMV